MATQRSTRLARASRAAAAPPARALREAAARGPTKRLPRRPRRRFRRRRRSQPQRQAAAQTGRPRPRRRTGQTCCQERRRVALHLRTSHVLSLACCKCSVSAHIGAPAERRQHTRSWVTQLRRTNADGMFRRRLARWRCRAGGTSKRSLARELPMLCAVRRLRNTCSQPRGEACSAVVIRQSARHARSPPESPVVPSSWRPALCSRRSSRRRCHGERLHRRGRYSVR